MLRKRYYKILTSFCIFFFMLLMIGSCNERESVTQEDTVVAQTDHTFMETFTLIDMHKTTHKVILSSKKLTMYDVEQPVVILHIFNTLDKENIYLHKTFTQLQEKYHNDVFVVSILVDDSIHTQELNTFIKQYKLKHYISNDIENKTFQNLLYESLSLSSNTKLPLTIVYSDGEYRIHYEGAMPKEMLLYDIKQAIKGE